MRKMAKITDKKLKKELDKFWSNTIKKIYGGICVGCGRLGTQAHHHLSKKANPSVRWATDNGLWLCFTCHILKIHRKGNYEWSRDLLIERIGTEGFADLKRKANIIRRYMKRDLIELREKIIATENLIKN